MGEHISSSEEECEMNRSRRRPTASERQRRGQTSLPSTSRAQNIVDEERNVVPFEEEGVRTPIHDEQNVEEELADEEETEDEESFDDEETEEEGEEVAEIDDGGPQIRDLITDYDSHVACAIWKNEEHGVLTCINHSFKLADWTIPEDCLFFKNLIEQSGLNPLIGSVYRCVNKYLISAFVERWYPETNTFHLPFGEMTITLDDVSSLLHIPVLGRPIEGSSYTSESACYLVQKYLGLSKTEANHEMNERVGYKLSLSMLVGLFEGLEASWDVKKQRRAAHAYLLYLLGHTIFADKSKSHVSLSLLEPLKNLTLTATFSWGSAALAFLYRQLGLASRVGVKQIAGYLVLLETWIWEHITCIRPSMRIYHESLPRALRWDPNPDSYISLKDIRTFLDRIHIGQVIFDPYMNARDFHPFYEIAWFTGCLLALNTVEPYHPNRVLRQFGKVQTIPPAPIPPVNTTRRRGKTTQTYTYVYYRFLDTMWAQWYNHAIPLANRSVDLNQSHLSCTEDYMPWFESRSVVRVQNPVYNGAEENQGGQHYQPSYDQLYLAMRGIHDLVFSPREQGEIIETTKHETSRYFG